MAIKNYNKNKYDLTESENAVTLEKNDGSVSSPFSPDFIEFSKPQETSPGSGQYTGVSEYEQNLATSGLTDDTQYTPVSSGALKNEFTFSGTKPGYTSSYAGQIQSLLNQIMNREDFSYDYTTDPLYEQYRDQYTREGNLAMRDTMGSAAALTGGYGNTYGTTAGSQAYQAYLGRLNEVVPQLQQLAYQQYLGEQTDLYNQLSALQALDNAEYGRYRDEVSDYYQDYANAYQQYTDSLSQQNYENEFAYQKQQDAIANAQWQASFDRDTWAQDLAAEQAARELAYKYAAAGLVYPYDDAASTWTANQIAASGGGSGGGSSSRSSSGSSSRGSSNDSEYDDTGYSRNYEVTLSNMKDYKARGVSNEKIADTILTQVANGTVSAEEGEEIAYQVGVLNELSSAVSNYNNKTSTSGIRSYKNNQTM